MGDLEDESEQLVVRSGPGEREDGVVASGNGA